MSTAVITVVAVVIPASAASLLVLALDIRGRRRRRPSRWAPSPSRLTAALGAALGVAGFGLASVAGIAGLGHSARAAATPEERLWVAVATAGGVVTPPAGSGDEAVRLPFAPLVLWGAGLDESSGGYTLLAEVAGGDDIPLLSGGWHIAAGEGARALDLIDPGAIAAAAAAHGVVPVNGVHDLELRSSDPEATLHLALAAPPAIPAPAPAIGAVPPATGAAAAAARPPLPATLPPARVTVPATGGAAPLLGGLALLVAGGACTGLSLRLRRAPPALR